MHQVADSLCGSATAHLSWQDRFGPTSGFGMFGSEARRVRNVTLSELEWGALGAAAGLAFLHWQGGPSTVRNNLRTLHVFCRSNENASAGGREQKIRRHALKALVGCAEWYIEGWPRFEADLRRRGVEEDGDPAERQKVLDKLTALLPRLKAAVSEA